MAEENKGGDLVDTGPPDLFSSGMQFRQLLDFRAAGALRLVTLHAKRNGRQARLVLAVCIDVAASTLNP